MRLRKTISTFCCCCCLTFLIALQHCFKSLPEHSVSFTGHDEEEGTNTEVTEIEARERNLESSTSEALGHDRSEATSNTRDSAESNGDIYNRMRIFVFFDHHCKMKQFRMRHFPQTTPSRTMRVDLFTAKLHRGDNMQCKKETTSCFLSNN
eukprot:764137-Hanusia_phi.AAC.1